MVSFLRRQSVVYSIELLIVLVAAFAFTSEYITRPRSYVPSGGDYGVSIFGRFFWDDVRACGTCALWNGTFMGGNPAFLDVSSDLFHPIAAIPSLLFGTMYGSRVAITITFALAGVSCWWLAQVLETGTVARLTAGLLGITGGYLAGRLQHGLVVLALSVVTASFLLPTALLLFKEPTRRHAALFGLFGGWTALSGQAYIQILVICLAPVFAILFFTNRKSLRLILLRIGEAGTIALAIASVQVLPVVHWWGRLGKDTDFSFSRAQQFKFVPTNLVLNDPGFYQSAILDREAGYPGLYSNYIGWAALALAVIGLVALAMRSKPKAAFLGFFTIGALWLSSGQLFEWLSRWEGHWELQEFAAGIRTPSNMANLAVPAMIGLTAVGIQYLIDSARSWYRIRFHVPIYRRTFTVTLSLAVLVPMLAVFVVRDVANQGKIWRSLENWDQNYESQMGAALESDELRWLTDLSHNPRLQILANRYELKIGNATRPWWIDDKYIPVPWGILGTDDSIPHYQQADINGISLLVRTAGNPYARIVTPSGHEIACVATGRGGHIDIACPEGAAGQLLVEERAFPGWKISIDGEQTTIASDQTWLGVQLTGGGSTIQLRFAPRYFWIGAGLSVAGTLWAFWWIVFPRWIVINPVRLRRSQR